MIHAGTDRRKSERIRCTHLPDFLKNIHIDLGSGDAITADILDISLKGMGLSAPVSTKEISSIFIHLSTVDQGVSVKEQILSTRSLTDTTSRISIMFRKENPFYAFV